MNTHPDEEDLVVHVLAFGSDRLSFTARGLLTHLLGSGQERHGVTELAAASGTSREELLRAIRELERASLVKLAPAHETGTHLALVTEHPASRRLPQGPPQAEPPDDPAVTQAGIAKVRAALQAARDNSAIRRHDHRPYVPPWQQASPAPEVGAGQRRDALRRRSDLTPHRDESQRCSSASRIHAAIPGTRNRKLRPSEKIVPFASRRAFR